MLYSIERRSSPEIHYRTAPEDGLRCNGFLLCLPGSTCSSFGGELDIIGGADEHRGRHTWFLVV